MRKNIVSQKILFEVKDVFGRKIRTTESYWQKIKEIKHTELTYGITEVKKTLRNPEEVRESVTDPTVFLYTKTLMKHAILVVAVKLLNGDGFLITVYQTQVYKKKGNQLWPK